MTQDDLKLVLDALKWCHGGEPCGTAEAIAVVEKALAQSEQFCDANCVWTDHHPDCKLAQPEQEPVACIVKGCINDKSQGRFVGDLCSPCHAFIATGKGNYSQAYRNTQRTWVGLTDEQIDACWNKDLWKEKQPHRIFAKAIESKLKEVNT